MKRKIHTVLLYVVLLVWTLGGAQVYAATTTLNSTINGGALSIGPPAGPIALVAVNASASSQATTGVVSAVNIQDNRGAGAGWTAKMSSQHLTYTKAPSASSGNTSPLITLNSGSRYDGTCGITSPATMYTVTISVGGSVGTAQYSVTGGCTGETLQTNVLTAATNNSVGLRGIKIDFPAGSYAVNDSWKIGVDVFPYTDLTITPQAATEAVAGSGLTGLTTGSSGSFSGTAITSNERTILQASSNNGMGSYNQNIDLSLTIHGNSYSGTFSGTVTFTVI